MTKAPETEAAGGRFSREREISARLSRIPVRCQVFPYSRRPTMSRLLVGTLSILALAGFTPNLKAADDDPKAIIDRAIKAQGGADYISKHQAAQFKSKGKMNVPGAGELDFTQETAYMLPDKFREQ